MKRLRSLTILEKEDRVAEDGVAYPAQRPRTAHGARARKARAAHRPGLCKWSGNKSPAQRAPASAGGDGRGAAGQRLDGPARRGAQSAGRASGRRARGTRQARGAKARTGGGPRALLESKRSRPWRCHLGRRCHFGNKSQGGPPQGLAGWGPVLEPPAREGRRLGTRWTLALRESPESSYPRCATPRKCPILRLGVGGKIVAGTRR